MREDAPRTTSDTQLLAACAHREREALSQLYDRHAAIFLATAVRILSDRTEAEDVLQETLIQIWEKAGTYSGGAGTPFAWMITILRNKAIERLRSQRRRAQLAGEVAARATVILEAPAVKQAADREGAAKVRALVNGLPQEQKQALSMAFFDGLTQQEIADTLQQPLGTVKARIRRGLMRLREGMEQFA